MQLPCGWCKLKDAAVQAVPGSQLLPMSPSNMSGSASPASSPGESKQSSSSSTTHGVPVY